ncbi:MAG TPA: CcdB family protein [Rhizomicrobium sp.]|jgi:toxin CcdB|nr:CcdB family protein [Rhizomicrobium sp.]
MTRQFDVFRNPLRSGRDQRPYVLAIQHVFLDGLPTRVVVPLVTEGAIHMLPRLNPSLTVLGQRLHLSPTEPFALALRYLRKPVAHLSLERDRIVAALDLVFTGI